MAQHGVLENRRLYRFDLVTDATMAASLAAYYLATRSTPSTLYTFDAYLSQFALEKEDAIRVTNTNFNRLRGALMTVTAANRYFHSGKNKSINFFRLFCECLSYRWRQESVTDSVRASELVSFLFNGQPFAFQESVLLLTALVKAVLQNKAETVSLVDLLSSSSHFSRSEAATITAAGEVAMWLAKRVADSVTIADSFVPSAEFGYGAGFYGLGDYGGATMYSQRSPDEAIVEEILALACVLAQTDTITAADSLFFASGYGGPAPGSGYGSALYGY